MTLNEQVELYRLTQTQDAAGTLVTTRTLIDKAMIKIRPLSGSERDRSQQNEAFANYRFVMHYRSDLQENDVIVWNSTDYNIKIIYDMGPKEFYLRVDAERGGAM